jgi:large subunit ribosomal protein L25
MKEEQIITVKKRLSGKKATELLKERIVPGVVYGHGIQTVSIETEYQMFRKAFQKAGRSTIIYLELDGKKIATIVHDVQYHPISQEYIHIDFLAIKENEEVHTSVPLIFVGTAPAVKNFGGILSTPLTHLEIKCLPKYLVHDVQVDVSSLEDFSDSISLGDLEITKNKHITILNEEDVLIASVNRPRTEKEESTTVEEVSGESAEKDKKEEK